MNFFLFIADSLHLLHLTLLQPYIDDIVSDNNLKALSADGFVNLYKNNNDFDSYTIQGKIN